MSSVYVLNPEQDPRFSPKFTNKEPGTERTPAGNALLRIHDKNVL